jgi:predicted acylesterase/phospholipase RssA
MDWNHSAVPTKEQATLFVCTGGGMPGLDIFGGMWLALAAYGIWPDYISGTSAGAIGGLFMAASADDNGAYRYCELLRSLSDRDIRDERVLWKLRLPFKRLCPLQSLQSSEKIAGLLRENTPNHWGQVLRPYSAWALNRRTGAKTDVAHHSLTEEPWRAALASMSISGFFPRVRLADGEQYVDAGPRFNCPLPYDWRRYRRVYILVAQTRVDEYESRERALTDLIWNVNAAIRDQILEPIEETAGASNVTVLWPDVHTAAGVLRFDHSLITAAMKWTGAALAKLPHAA